MSRLESIEQQIKTLSPQELAELRKWFIKFDSASLQALREQKPPLSAGVPSPEIGL